MKTVLELAALHMDMDRDKDMDMGEGKEWDADDDGDLHPRHRGLDNRDSARYLSVFGWYDG